MDERAGKQVEIRRKVTCRMASVWLANSRYRETSRWSDGGGRVLRTEEMEVVRLMSWDKEEVSAGIRCGVREMASMARETAWREASADVEVLELGPAVAELAWLDDDGRGEGNIAG